FVSGGIIEERVPQVYMPSVIKSAGSFVRSWPSSCCYWAEISVDSAGLAYVPTTRGEGLEDRGDLRVRYALDGTARDTLRSPRGPEPATWSFSGSSGGAGQVNRMMMTMAVPLSPTTVRTYHPAGGMVYGFARSYELVRTLGGSDTALVFGRAWTAEPLPDSVREAAVARQVERLG